MHCAAEVLGDFYSWNPSTRAWTDIYKTGGVVTACHAERLNDFTCIPSSPCYLFCETGSVGRYEPSPSRYYNSEAMAWVIGVETATRVTLHFTNFDTEGNYDFVTVFSCTDSSCWNTVQLGRFSGTNMPANVTSSTGFMRIVWTSDSIITYTGWTAEWTTGSNQAIGSGSGSGSGSVTQSDFSGSGSSSGWGSMSLESGLNSGGQSLGSQSWGGSMSDYSSSGWGSGSGSMFSASGLWGHAAGIRAQEGRATAAGVPALRLNAVPAKPPARKDHGFAACQDKLYTFGGIGEAGESIFLLWFRGIVSARTDVILSSMRQMSFSMISGAGTRHQGSGRSCRKLKTPQVLGRSMVSPH